jgi:8-oxo-dGTP diphosphatase
MRSFVIVKVLIVNSNGEVLGLRRGETAPRRAGEWDFPGGFLDEGEDLTKAVLREAKEEVDIALPYAHVAFAMSEPGDSPDHGSGTWMTFVAHVEGVPEVTLSFEHQEYTWLKPEELLGKITYRRQRQMLNYIIRHNLLEP